MNKLIALLPLLLLLSKVACKFEEKPVITITDSTYEEVLNMHKCILIKFYAPWCGHCQALEPEYAKAAKTLKAQNSPQYLAEVDGTSNPELSKTFGINSYPTIWFYCDGKWQEYNGGRQAKQIVSWVNQKTKPEFKEAEEKHVLEFNDKNFNDEIIKHKNILIKVYAPWCGHCKQFDPEFKKAAKILSKQNPPQHCAEIDDTVNPELERKFGVKKYPTLWFFSNGNWIEYTGERNAENIVEWYNNHLTRKDV